MIVVQGSIENIQTIGEKNAELKVLEIYSRCHERVDRLVKQVTQSDFPWFYNWNSSFIFLHIL